MSAIEKHLHEHFASLDKEDGEELAAAQSATDVEGLRDSVPAQLDQPFAKVHTVTDGSPAAEAGLKVGDAIRNFGYVNAGNNDGLRRVAECVQGNEGVSLAFHDDRRVCFVSRHKHRVDHDHQQNILVKVCRITAESTWPEELQLMLKPRANWGGRGTLGCRILPL
jgi:26S proteasome regulatory subunit N4